MSLETKKHKFLITLAKAFPITSVCRDDLISAGYSEKQVASLDDGDMARIAEKMADAYCDSGFWIDLPIITDYVLEENKKEESLVIDKQGNKHRILA